MKISSPRCIAKSVKTLENMDGVYQIGQPAQLDETTIAVGLNIRCCGGNAIDLEVGNDIRNSRAAVRWKSSAKGIQSPSGVSTDSGGSSCPFGRNS
jgi:hypothetical protein